MIQELLAPPAKISAKQSDTLSETSTECCEQSEGLDRQEVQGRGRNVQAPNNKAKSSLCRNFMEKGACPYGSKCQFAHGPHELKCNADLQHMSYKTRPCHAFARKAHCPYGQRCNFLHIPDPAEPQPALHQYRDLLYPARNGPSSLLIARLTQL